MEQLGFSSFFDACAGIGCFHLGIVNSAPSVNYRCLGMAEEDSRLRKLYLKNFKGDFQNFGDVHILSGTKARETTNEEKEFKKWVDLVVPKGALLTAGFPCQPFSKSGEQKGVNDSMRGTVFYSLLKMLEDKNFSGFILENVDNLSGPNHREDFKLMIEALGRNYHVTHFVESPHNMDGDYSIQHRQRVFIVGLNKKQFDNPGDKYMSSEEDRRTHWKKKQCAELILQRLPNPEEKLDEYTSSGGTITKITLQEIGKHVAGLALDNIESKKKQDLLKELIENRNGEYTPNMISKGSTITAAGWNKLIELYIDDSMTLERNLGFVERMGKLRDKKRIFPAKNHMTALKLWNEFLRLLPIHEEPCSPVWSMEFGMDYDLNDLRVEGLAIEDFKKKNNFENLPPYISNLFSEDGILTEPIPDWKKDFIEKNREFYINNKQHLSRWLNTIRNNSEINNTLQKFEWQCEPSTWKDIIQELKKTFTHLGWNNDSLNQKTISSPEKFCNVILNKLNHDLEFGISGLLQTLDLLNFDLGQGDQEDVFLSKTKDKFTVKGLRILNRLLRKHAKLEPRTMIGNVVQFRPSGIRFSDSETSPALVAIGQIPFLVEKLTNKGVYKLSTKQAAYLQGIDLEKPEFKNFKNLFSQSEKQLTTNEQFMRLGNAVNVELVRRIVYQFNEVAKEYQK